MHGIFRTLVVGWVGVAAALQPVAAQDLTMDKMWGNSTASGSKDAERGHLFQWGNYAMFVHWGLYSHLANVWDGKTYYGIGEWMINSGMASADRDEYKATARSFNPTEFDAMELAQLAKDAGMKYVIITSKHHDGFAMYDSDCDPFNIVDATPFGRDPMKELAEACKKLGLGFGFYYSHNQDWTTPGADGAPRVDKDGNPKTFKDYFYSKCLPQVEEITRNYGDIELIWFDTPGAMPEDYARKLVDVVHTNQPRALVSGRVGYGLGDYQTFGDMEVPLKNVGGLWESVDVTNDVWGYAWYDRNWKTPKTILQNLISTVARGGTYMLNVGPDGKGNVPAFAQQALRTSGKWIARYPQVIYGAAPSPWQHALPWGDVVKQGNNLYLCIYEWPKTGELYMPGLQTHIKKASLLSGSKKGKVRVETLADSWVRLVLPDRGHEPLISVVELEMSTDTVSVDPTLGLDPVMGMPTLSVAFAEAEKCSIYKSSWMEKFGEWKHRYCVSNLGNGGQVVWTLNVQRPGVYNVQVEARGAGRVVWRLETDEKQVVQNQQGTSSDFTFKPMGWVKFDKPGKHTLTFCMPEGGQADLASISLTPVYLEATGDSGE